MNLCKHFPRWLCVVQKSFATSLLRTSHTHMTNQILAIPAHPIVYIYIQNEEVSHRIPMHCIIYQLIIAGNHQALTQHPYKACAMRCEGVVLQSWMHALCAYCVTWVRAHISMHVTCVMSSHFIYHARIYRFYIAVKCQSGCARGTMPVSATQWTTRGAPHIIRGSKDIRRQVII